MLASCGLAAEGNGAPDLAEPRVVLAAVKTASRRFAVGLSASLDRRCARRVAACAGRDGEAALSAELRNGIGPESSDEDLPNLTEVRIKWCLSLQEGAGKC